MGTLRMTGLYSVLSCAKPHLNTLLAYSLGKGKAEFKSALTLNSDHQAILGYQEMEAL